MIIRPLVFHALYLVSYSITSYIRTARPTVPVVFAENQICLHTLVWTVLALRPHPTLQDGFTLVGVSHIGSKKKKGVTRQNVRLHNERWCLLCGDWLVQMQVLRQILYQTEKYK